MAALGSDGVSAAQAVPGLSTRPIASLPVDRVEERKRARERAARRRRRGASKAAGDTPKEPDSRKGRRIDVRV